MLSKRKDMKYFFGLFLVIMLASCSPGEELSENPDELIDANSPEVEGGGVGGDVPESDGFIDEGVETVYPEFSGCGIESWHGLDIICVQNQNLLDVCDQSYQLGDFCRKYAKCEVIDNRCQFVENVIFENCKKCVEECATTNDIIASFQCDTGCREQFE